MCIRKSVVALSTVLLVSAFSANASTAQKIESAEHAHTVIEQYKTLRSECTESRGEERKACFNRLNGQNQLYSFAKKFLSTSSVEKQNSVHYVTFNE